jgi:hypothetical protein
MAHLVKEILKAEQQLQDVTREVELATVRVRQRPHTHAYAKRDLVKGAMMHAAMISGPWILIMKRPSVLFSGGGQGGGGQAGLRHGWRGGPGPEAIE